MDPFVKLVKEMRDCQKAWFRYHKKEDLQKALKLEMKVDSIIQNYNVLEIQPPDQLGLFPDNVTEF